MSDDDRVAEKKKRLEEALGQGIAMIHLDARQPGVVVPAKLRVDFHLRLNLSWRFMPPDLSLNAWGVRETLSFGGVPTTIAVPWQAIFAITGPKDQQAFLFPEDMPQELLAAAAKNFGLDEGQAEKLMAEARTEGQLEAAPPPEEPRKRFTPRVISAEEIDEPPAEAPGKGPDDGGAAPKKSHLRIVK